MPRRRPPDHTPIPSTDGPSAPGPAPDGPTTPEPAAAAARRSTGRRKPAAPVAVAADLLLVLPLRTAVVLPGEQTVLPVGRAASIAAVRAARAGDGRVLLCPQQDPECEQPSTNDLCEVGTVARLVEVEPEGTGLRVAVQGLARATWDAAVADPADGPLHVAITQPNGSDGDAAGLVAAATWLWQQVRGAPPFRTTGGPEGAGLPPVERPGAFADALGARLLQRREERLELLRCFDAAARLQALHRLVLPRLPRPAADPDLARRTLRQMQEQQRRYHLQEQLKAIRHELGEDQDAEADRWRARLQAEGLPPVALEAALREAARLERLPPLTAEAAIARTYLEWLAELPWTRSSAERGDLASARQVLDLQHHGLELVKERILEHLAVHLLHRQRSASAGGGAPPGTALCLVGPPGTGKTSLVHSMAEALGRPFVRVALGGVRDEAEIRGHRRTYVGALPGRLLAGMRRAGVLNPVMLLDEIDKLGDDGRGDPSAALLEVLDPEQQGVFSDHYLEVPFDLSQVMFVATANDVMGMPAPLRDRLELVQLPPYTVEEKAAIALRHLLPRQITLHALPPETLTVTEGAVRALIRGAGDESGVRALERQIAALCRKAARRVLEDPAARLHVTALNVGRWVAPAGRGATEDRL